MRELTGGAILGLSGGMGADYARDLDRTRARLQAVTAAMREAAERTVEGSSADGTVTATVTVDGKLVELHVSAYAMRDLDHVALGATAVEAIIAARKVGAAALRETLGDVTGETLPLSEEFDLAEDPMAFLRSQMGRG